MHRRGNDGAPLAEEGVSVMSGQDIALTESVRGLLEGIGGARGGMAVVSVHHLPNTLFAAVHAHCVTNSMLLPCCCAP